MCARGGFIEAALGSRRLHSTTYIVLFMFIGTAHALPPVINSITPASVIQNTVPQPTITVTGSNFISGVPSSTNRPLITLTHQNAKATYSTLANVNFAGT